MKAIKTSVLVALVLLLAVVIFYASYSVVDTGTCPQGHPKCGVPHQAPRNSN